MAEPLVISFAADTSRAQSAMATLAAQIVGNMTSIGVAMSGGAANSNSFSGALSGLAANVQRAAAAVGADVKNISSATASAATADKATLEGVVRAFTGAAAASNTAGTAVRSGLTATTSSITGIVAQIPSLTTLLGAFIAFEAVKLVFESVNASIDEARKHVEDFVKIGKDADRLGVGTNFFQRATLDAKALGLETQQVIAALEKARDASTVRIGEGEHGKNTSAIDGRLTQNVRAGNLSAGDKAAFDAAGSQEARIRSVLNLIDKLRDEGRDLAAFDLAGKFFGADFENKLREGVDLTRRLRENLDSKEGSAGGQRIVDPEEIARAQQLDTKLTDIHNTFATALIPVQRDASNAALDIYNHFLDFEGVLGRVAIVASNLYVQLSKVPGAIDAAIPSAGRLATLLGAVDFGKALGIDQIGPKLKEVLGNTAKAVGAGDALGLPRTGETQQQADDRNALAGARDLLRERLKQAGSVSSAVEASNKLDFRARPPVADRSRVLPSLNPRQARGGREREETDPVETFINGLQKSAAAAKAEADNFAKSNAEKRVAIELAKAQEIASQNGKTLTDAQTAAITKAADETGRYKDKLADLEQQQRQAAEAARFFADSLSNGLADAIVNGKSLGSVFTDLTKQLERSVLTGLLTGTGPLAGLLGTAPAASLGSNATGGLLGSAFGGLLNRSGGGPVGALQGPTLSGATLDATGGGIGGFFASLFRANGGPVSAGQPVTVGEMGRELFVPNADGKVMPIMGGAAGAGSQSIDQSRSYNIDARGAQMGVADQITARLAAYDQGLNRSLAARTAVANRRYSRAG